MYAVIANSATRSDIMLLIVDYVWALRARRKKSSPNDISHCCHDNIVYIYDLPTKIHGEELARGLCYVGEGGTFHHDYIQTQIVYPNYGLRTQNYGLRTQSVYNINDNNKNII